MLGSDLLKPVGCVTSAPAVHGAVMARQAPDKKDSADAEGYTSNRVFCRGMVLAGDARSAVPVLCQMMMLQSAAISQRQQEPGPPVQCCKGHFTPQPIIITTPHHTTLPYMISPHPITSPQHHVIS